MFLTAMTVIKEIWNFITQKKEISKMEKHSIQNNNSIVGNVGGNFTYAPKQETHIYQKTKIKEKYIPGTIEADPDLSAYLKHLINIYNRFYKADCVMKKKRLDYSQIRRDAIEKIGYPMEKAPAERAKELFNFIIERIKQTGIGKNKIKKGEHLVSTFEEFNAEHNK